MTEATQAGVAKLGPMKKISIGRADLMVPEDARLTMTGEVNEVKLRTEEMKPGETFSRLWNDRVKLIDSGAGEPTGGTVILKRYPDSAHSGQVYYSQGKDPGILVVMERWAQVGSLLVKGREEFEPKYLSDVEKDVDKVFENLSVGTPAGPGDFAVNDVVVHLLPEGGGESTDAGVVFQVPGTAGKPAIEMRVSFKTKLLVTAGSITILPRAKEAAHAPPEAAGRVEVLRARKVTVGSLPGDESVLIFTNPANGEKDPRAEWGSPGVANDAFAPQTEMLYEVHLGDHPDVALALASWDAIRSSLRFRR